MILPLVKSKKSAIAEAVPAPYPLAEVERIHGTLAKDQQEGGNVADSKSVKYGNIQVLSQKVAALAAGDSETYDKTVVFFHSTLPQFGIPEQGEFGTRPAKHGSLNTERSCVNLASGDRTVQVL